MPFRMYLPTISRFAAVLTSTPSTRNGFIDNDGNSNECRCATLGNWVNRHGLSLPANLNMNLASSYFMLYPWPYLPRFRAFSPSSPPPLHPFPPILRFHLILTPAPSIRFALSLCPYLHLIYSVPLSFPLSSALSAPTNPVPTAFNCPPRGKSFFRDIFDCSVYHFCDDGVDETFDCPGGFHYDVKEAKCDWPNKETCECPGWEWGKGRMGQWGWYRIDAEAWQARALGRMGA